MFSLYYWLPLIILKTEPLGGFFHSNWTFLSCNNVVLIYSTRDKRYSLFSTSAIGVTSVYMDSVFVNMANGSNP